MKLASIDIHRAQFNEASDISAVHLAAWRDAYRGIIPHTTLEQMIARRGDAWWKRAIRRGTHVLVIDFNGSIVGYATVGINRARTLPHEGEIYELYILPEYQGIGLGARLFSSARMALKDYGLTNNVLWVLEENDRACSFYDAMGGETVARSAETFGERNLSKIAYAWGA
ncbi:MAG: GNAT family N-acetyltransferase [Pseudomonadota bacterium]